MQLFGQEAHGRTLDFKTCKLEFQPSGVVDVIIVPLANKRVTSTRHREVP